MSLTHDQVKQFQTNVMSNIIKDGVKVGDTVWDLLKSNPSLRAYIASEPQLKSMLEWKVVDVDNKNRNSESGLYAAAFQKPSGGVAIVARDTEGFKMINDSRTNLMHSLGMTSPQLRDLNEFFDRVEREYVIEDAMGMSLAGYMMKMMTLTRDGNWECYSLNAPGITATQLAWLAQNGMLKNSHRITEFLHLDFISFTGNAVPGQRTFLDFGHRSGGFNHLTDDYLFSNLREAGPLFHSLRFFGDLLALQQIGAAVWLRFTEFNVTVLQPLISWAQDQWDAGKKLGLQILEFGVNTLANMKAEIDRGIAYITNNLEKIKTNGRKLLDKYSFLPFARQLRLTFEILVAFVAASKYLGMLIKKIGTSIKKLTLAVKNAVSVDISVNLFAALNGSEAAQRAMTHLVDAQDQLGRLQGALQTLSFNVGLYNTKALIENKPRQSGYPMVYGGVNTGLLNGTRTYFGQVEQNFKNAEAFAVKKLASL